MLARTGANVLQSDLTLDMSPEKYNALISSISPSVKTPVSTAFEMIKMGGQLKDICFISSIMNKSSTVPEILTINGLTIYGKQVRAVSNLKFKGAWTNISAYLSRPKDRYSDPTIKGSNELMALVVRSVICMAHDDNEDWLNSRGQAFLVGFYAWAMSHIVGRLFSFDVEEGAIARYAFAHYYAAMLNSRRDANNAPDLLNRTNNVFAHGRVSKEDLDKRMRDIVGNDDINMDHVIKFIVTHGPARASKLSAGNVYQALLSSSRSNVPTVISANYPPYLLYMILRTVANDKHPLFTNILNNRYTRQQVDSELDAIVRDKSTYAGINISK